MRTADHPRAAAILALALAAAPAAARAGEQARCTIPDAEDWREYRSRHFVVWTDASRRSAKHLVKELELLRKLVVTALFGGEVDVPGRTKVVAFGSLDRYEELAPEHAAGYFRVDASGQKTIVVAFDGRSLPAGEVVAHELTHEISWHHFTRQPPWFAEGLALFVQTVGQMRPDPWRSGRLVGSLSPGIFPLAERLRTVDVAQLLPWRGGTESGNAEWYYAQSWLLYHFLRERRANDLAAFQERLASGDDPDDAWRAAFPELDPADDGAMTRFNRQLVDYLSSAEVRAIRIAVPELEAPFEERSVGSADLHVALLGLRSERRWPATEADRKALVAATIEEALREDPLQPDALAMRARASGSSVAAAIRPATVARPDDFRGWLVLADALDPEADAREKEAALRRAVALAPDDARANRQLARFLLGTGRSRDARSFAERALDLAPWDPAMVDTLAAVAFGIGQCKAALALERRAVDGFGRGADGDAARRRLADYEARCGQPAGAGTPPVTPGTDPSPAPPPPPPRTSRGP